MANKSTRSAFQSEASSREQQSDILRPTHFDVIFGKGKPFQMHSGNRRMHRIASMHKTDYNMSSKPEKKLIADMVLQRIKNGGIEPVQFLKRVDGELWVEVGDDEARQKVGRVLRGTRTKNLERADAITEQETTSASLSLNQSPIPTFETPSMVANSNIALQPLYLLLNEPLSAPPVLPIASRSINPTFLTAAALSWGPTFGMHGLLSHREANRLLVTDYPLAPTMCGTPFGMVGAPVSPRNFVVTPIGLLTDAQVLEMLFQRRLTERPQVLRGRL
jgi:hypothetical protein